MSYRQRNVPVTSKEEVSVQTDVRLLQPTLLHPPQTQQQQQHPPPQIKLSRLHDKSGLLTPFSDQQLLRQFSKTLEELRAAQPADNPYAKRLELLQNQISGLLKRDLLINGVAEGSQKWSSYYLTLNQKQKAIIRLQNQKLLSDAKIQQLHRQIQHLQKELHNLRSSLLNSHKAVEQNQLYASLFQKINETLSTGKNKPAQLEQIIAEQIVPLTTEFQFNLSAVTRNVDRNVPQSIKGVVSNLAREFDRLLKEPQFTQQKLSDTVVSLINNFKTLKGVDYLKNQFQLASKTQQAQDNYLNMLSLLKHQIQTLKSQPQNIHRFDSLLRKLEEPGVQLFDCKGWINLVSPSKIVEVNSEDKKLKELIGVLGSEFKRAYSKFPELKNHVSSKLIELFETQALVELIQGGSIQKLNQIIIHEVEAVRVQNVYQYESSSSSKIIFHLRVLLKRLLQELDKIKKTHPIDLNLDQGILQLMKNHIIDGFNTEDYISLFRPIPKIVQVPVVVDRPIYETKTFEKSIPINIESQVVLRQQKATVVAINKEVPVYIQKPIDHVIKQNIPVIIQTQKAVPVEVVRELLTERTVQSSVQVPVMYQKSVGLYEREQVVRQVEVEKLVQKVEFKEVQKIIQTGGREYIQVEKIVQKPVYLYETRQQIKQVQVRVPQIVKQTEYIQIQKKIPYIIQHRQIVTFDREIPIQIRVPEVEVVEVIEYRDKPVVVKEYKEVVKQIPVTKQKELLRETPKQIFIERSHFIKADQVEVIKEVQVFVDRPLIRQILISKDTQVDKIVPLYISEQVPVIHEVSVPYVSQKVKQLKVQKLKLVPVKEQIIKPVHVEKPVPVVVQKQIVKIQTQIVQHIVEKIVEVPRVVEIQKIVQKIVVVPRIIQKIVEVPRIIEKIVVVEQPVLQIVEIQVPYIVIQEVDRPIEVVIEKVVVEIQKQIEIVQVQRIVERIIQRDRPVQVQVERRIPYEVVRQVAVPTYRDRVEYIKQSINETKVQTIEVQVPILFQQKVPFYVEKPIVTEHVIEQPVYEKIYVERQKVIVNEVQKLVVREILVEKPVEIEVVKQIPGPQTIKYIYEPKIVEVIKEKIVQLHDKVEVPKEIYLLQEKIVHEIHQKMLQVPVNSIVMTPQLVQVPKLVYLTHYKQIAVDVPVRQERIKRDIVQQVKTVQLIKEVPVEVQIYRQQIKEITNEIRQYITSEIVKQIRSQVQVRSPVQYQVIEVAGKTVVQQLSNTNQLVQTQDKIIERVIEKIVMLPQIVEVVRNIHHISEVNSLGVAVNQDINVQTQKYRAVSQELKKSLVQLLKNLRSNVARQPELKNLIGTIQKHLKVIDNWISFPKLIEVPKEVVKEVEKERVVLVPTADKQKEAVLSYILQKVLNQLRRINQQHNIQLSLEDQLLKIFFPPNASDKALDNQLAELTQSLKSRVSSFGDWSQSNPFLVNAFLQDHFSLQSLIREANKTQQEQAQQINSLKQQADIATNKYENLLYYNRKIFDDNLDLISLLEKYRNYIADEQLNPLLEKHREFYDQLLQQKPSFLASSLKRIQKYNESIVEHYEGEQDPSKVSDLGQLVSKINRYQDSNQKLLTQTRLYENQLQKSKQELNIKNNIIKRLEDEYELKLSRRKDDLAKSPNVNKELIQQNKQLQEQNKTLSRQASAQKVAADRSKKEFQNFRKDYDARLEKKDKELKDLAERLKKQNEKELNKLKQDLDRIKKQKERQEAELADIRKKTTEEVRLLREQQRPPTSDKHTQLINENSELRKKTEALQHQFEKLKQAASENNLINDQQLSRLRQQNEKLVSERRELQKKKKEGIFGFSPEAGKKNVELTKKIETLEAELKTKDQKSAEELKTLRQRVKQLQIELENFKRQAQAAQKSQVQSKAFRTSGIKPTTSIIQQQGQGSITRTPGSGVRKSLEKGYMSPEIPQSKEESGEGFGSPQSRLSQQSSEQGQTYYKPKMNLREFMEAKHSDKDRDMYITFVMIKIIQKIELQVDTGRYNSYSPSNIFLINFNVANLEQLNIKFGYPIKDKNFKNDGLYLSPEVLMGGQSSKRSTVFTLGVILDELIHGTTFFKSTNQIQNPAIEFKVRGDKLNPILKNTLFQMMNKEPNKRLELLEAKRRLSLQKYITTEGRGSMTSSSRLGRG